MNIIEFFQLGDELYKNMMMPICEKHNITYMELTIILFLGNNPTLDKACDIVEKRHIAKSHASSTIKSLIDKQLIEGACLKCDRRSVHLKLLPNAYEIFKDGQAVQKEFFDIYTSELSNNEIEMLKNVLNKMENTLLKRKVMKNGK